MRPAQKARQLLNNHWMTAVSVQSIILAASMAMLLIELAVLRITHLGTETVAYVNAFYSGKWAYGAVTVGTLLLDWLFISPLLLGQSLYYWRLAAGEKVSFTAVFTFCQHGYGRALQWRLFLFLRRMLWTALCYLPAALVMGYAELVRRSGSNTPLADITLMLCTMFGFLLLLAGFLVSEMLMLRYLPAAYLTALDSEDSIHSIFRQSREVMKGHIGETFWTIIGFIGWFLSCLLVAPYFYVSPLFRTSLTIVIRRYLAEMEPSRQHKIKNRNKPSV